MSESCKVVRVVRPECPGGFCEINEVDFDSARHILFQEKTADKDKENEILKKKKKG